MKNLFRLCLFLLFTGLISACNTSSNNADEPLESTAESVVTTIYLVRHAEKDTTDAANEDPGLTEAGHARAKDLLALLEGIDVDALYATKYMRTSQTLEPLALDQSLSITQYEAHDFHGLKERLLQEHRGETVVVAGHSNTLLPIVETFGVEKPFAEINDSQYRYLFKITVQPDDKATLEVTEFGN